MKQRRSLRAFRVLVALSLGACGSEDALPNGQGDAGEEGGSVKSPPDAASQSDGSTSSDAGATEAGPSLDDGGGHPGPPLAALNVQGRFLRDVCGEQIVIRGIETGNKNADLHEIVKAEANAVRLVFAMTAAELEANLKIATDAHMLVSMIPANGALDTSWWNKPDIKAVLLKYQPWILPHVYGEGAYNADSVRWLSETKKVVSDLRSFGYQFPLEILADQWGQELDTLLKHGQEVIDADPLHNVLLGDQMYSITHPDDPTIASVVNSGLPIMLGTCSYRDPANPSQGWYGAPLDQYKQVWQKTFENQIGSFYWDWGVSNDGMTTNGKYGSWTDKGQVIAGNGQYATPKTAKKTHWMLTGQCATN
jgi:mannan endo-1,4-beta-mannosidase